MMKCEHIKNYLLSLSRFEIGNIPDKDVSEHLSNCSNCRSFCESQKNFLDTISSFYETKAIPNQKEYTEQVLYKIRREKSRKGHTLRFLAVAAVILITVTTTLYKNIDRFPGNQNQEQMVENENEVNYNLLLSRYLHSVDFYDLTELNAIVESSSDSTDIANILYENFKSFPAEEVLTTMDDQDLATLFFN